MERTSIQVTDELADELYNRKDRGESYEDVIWRLIEKAEEDIAEEKAEEDIAEESSSSRDAIEADPGHSPEPGASGIEPFLSDVDFPASRDRAECIEAVRAAYEHLQQDESATMREFVREVMPEYPVGYDVPELQQGERYRGAWWRKVVKPGLTALPDVQKPPKGGSKWKYVAGDSEDTNE